MSEAREYLAEAREGAVSEPRVLRIAQACVAAEEQVEAIRAISQRARRQWRKVDYVELEGILGGTGGCGHRWCEMFGRGFVLGNVIAAPPGCALLIVTGHIAVGLLFVAIFIMSIACLARFGGRL